MSEVAAPVVPAVAPTNGAHPTTPQKPAAAIKAPVESKPVEVDDSEEYVVDGKPVRLNKAQRQLHFQKALAADKRMKEAADARNKLADDEKLFEEDPEAYFAKKGKDGSKFIAAHLEKKAKLELMSPEQREAQRLQSERDEYKAKVEAVEAKEKAAKQAAIDERNFKALETQLIAAADTHGLDGSPETLESLCDIAIEFIEAEVPISAEQVAQEHIRRERERLEARDKKLLPLLKGKKLLAYIGPAALAEIKAAMAEADAASLNDIPKPQARPKVQVKAHVREVKGYVRESDFDKKFLK